MGTKDNFKNKIAPHKFNSLNPVVEPAPIEGVEQRIPAMPCSPDGVDGVDGCVMLNEGTDCDTCPLRVMHETAEQLVEILAKKDACEKAMADGCNAANQLIIKQGRQLKDMADLILTKEEIGFLVDMIENEWDIDGVTMPSVWQGILTKLRKQAEQSEAQVGK